jgi:hypothetical protein
MSQLIPSPSALINVLPAENTAVLLARGYWNLNGGTGDVTLTTDPSQESLRLAYVSADTAYELTAVGSVGTAAVLATVVRAGSDYLIY